MNPVPEASNYDKTEKDFSLDGTQQPTPDINIGAVLACGRRAFKALDNDTDGRKIKMHLTPADFDFIEGAEIVEYTPLGKAQVLFIRDGKILRRWEGVQ